jgi:hypothetical protein
MPMKNPPHPGRSIKDACLDPLGLTVTEGAKVLGVTRNTLSRVDQRAVGHLGGDGHPARESRLVERRPLAAAPDGLRTGASAAA